MIRIMGLDLSLNGTGVVLPAGWAYTIKCKAAQGDGRLQIIRDQIRQYLADADADLVVIEDLPTHAHAAGVTGMVHGAVRTEIMDTGIPYVLIAPATLKAFATGKGNADKAAMILSAYKRSGQEFADDNQCDAAWLRWAGMDHYGAPEFDLPKTQRDRLSKVKWPLLTRGTSPSGKVPGA